MTQIIKGGNLPAPGQVWKVAVVRGPSGGGVPKVEAAALLLDAVGRVRDNGDLVFRDRRAHTSGGGGYWRALRTRPRRRAERTPGIGARSAGCASVGVPRLPPSNAARVTFGSAVSRVDSGDADGCGTAMAAVPPVLCPQSFPRMGT